MFEAITIRKQGFPFRLSHEDFTKRFKCILPKKSWGSKWKEASLELIAAMGQDLKLVQMGVTKVLYRAGEHKNMELKRNIAVEATVIFLQRVTRGWLARRLAKELRKHKPELKAAIVSRDLAKIEHALSHAAGLRFPLKEWEDCKKLRALIIEERRVTALLESLVKLDPEENFEALSKAIAAANECNLENAVSTKARALLAEVVDRKKTRAWLVEGVDEADIEKLEWALKRAAELKLGNAAAEIDKARKEKERIEKEQKIVASLVAAMAKGGYLAEGDSIDFSGLDTVAREAQSFGMKTKEGVTLEKQAHLFVRIRQTMRAALGTKDKALWKAVESVVMSAGEAFSELPEVAKAAEEVSHQAAVDEICEKLSAALDQLDQDQMSYGLSQARNLKVDEVKYPVVSVAHQFLDKIHEARRLVQAAVHAVEQGALEEAVAYAESFGYDFTAEVQHARQLRDTLIQLNAEAAHAVIMLEEDQMKAILARADAIHATTVDIEKLRTLLLNTPEEKFVQVSSEEKRERRGERREGKKEEGSNPWQVKSSQSLFAPCSLLCLLAATQGGHRAQRSGAQHPRHHSTQRSVLQGLWS